MFRFRDWSWMRMGLLGGMWFWIMGRLLVGGGGRRCDC